MPSDLLMHRFLWSGLAFLPLVLRGGIRDLRGIGWGRGMALMVLGGPVMSLISYTGFLFVPLGHGSVIQPSCATLGGLFLAAVLLKERVSLSRFFGACRHRRRPCRDRQRIDRPYRDERRPRRFDLRPDRLDVRRIRALVRYWRVSAFSAAAVINVLSLSLFPVYAATGGLGRVAAIGLGENALQALGQGILAGPAAMYLFAFSIQLLGVARAAIVPAIVPALTLLLGWLLLGEPPTALQAAGLFTVLAGFYLAQRQR